MSDDDQARDDDQTRCMERAAPLLPELHEAWHEAFAQYQDYPPEILAEHDDTTAANCIRSHLWKRIIALFDGRRGCRLLRIKGLNVLNYEDEIVWRFKKVDRTGRHHNYQTQQQMDFDDQLPLPGIPEELCGSRPVISSTHQGNL